MAIVTLTDAFIRNLVNKELDQPGQWDTEVRGMVLRVTRHGTAAFHVRATPGWTQAVLQTWPVAGAVAEGRAGKRAHSDRPDPTWR